MQKIKCFNRKNEVKKNERNQTETVFLTLKIKQFSNVFNLIKMTKVALMAYFDPQQQQKMKKKIFESRQVVIRNIIELWEKSQNKKS